MPPKTGCGVTGTAITIFFFANIYILQIVQSAHWNSNHIHLEVNRVCM